MMFKKVDHDAERKRCTSDVQVELAPSSSSYGYKKVTLEEIEFVQHQIERCLLLYMTKDEATTMLVHSAKIDQGFIHLVWQRLEEENSEFFEAYEIQLELKKQIISYNQLLLKQYHLMNSKHYAMQQSLDYGHGNMRVNSCIGFPDEQPYPTFKYPSCNGSLNHMINEVPTVSDFYLNQQNGHTPGDDQEEMATDVFDPQSSVELNEFLPKQDFLPNICSTEEFHIGMDTNPHFNMTNDWINFEDHTALESSHISYSDISNVKIEPPDCLIADAPSTETQSQTDKDKNH